MEDLFSFWFVCIAMYLGVLSVGCFKTYLEFKHNLKTQEDCDHKYVLDTQYSLTTYSKDFTEKETSTKAKCCLCGHETLRRCFEQNRE